MKKTKLVCGVGVNDADYTIQKMAEVVDESGKKRYKLLWTCPFYIRWKNLLTRCFSDKVYRKFQNYKDCTVCEEWLRFSNFKAWMESQDWEGKELDKDLLIKDNKHYCPDKCVFVSQTLNTFLTDRANNRGPWPLGVVYMKRLDKFQAACSNPFVSKGEKGKLEYLGIYENADEAHEAWRKRKHELALMLAGRETEPRIISALSSRYSEEDC